MNELEQASVNSNKKRYGLIAFFLLSFAFTWANWLPRAASARGLVAIEPPDFVALIAGYGPALAAIRTYTFSARR